MSNNNPQNWPVTPQNNPNVPWTLGVAQPPFTPPTLPHQGMLWPTTPQSPFTPPAWGNGGMLNTPFQPGLCAVPVFSNAGAPWSPAPQATFPLPPFPNAGMVWPPIQQASFLPHTPTLTNAGSAWTPLKGSSLTPPPLVASVVNIKTEALEHKSAFSKPLAHASTLHHSSSSPHKTFHKPENLVPIKRKHSTSDEEEPEQTTPWPSTKQASNTTSTHTSPETGTLRKYHLATPYSKELSEVGWSDPAITTMLDGFLSDLYSKYNHYNIGSFANAEIKEALDNWKTFNDQLNTAIDNSYLLRWANFGLLGIRSQTIKQFTQNEPILLLIKKLINECHISPCKIDTVMKDQRSFKGTESGLTTLLQQLETQQNQYETADREDTHASSHAVAPHELDQTHPATQFMGDQAEYWSDH